MINWEALKGWPDEDIRFPPNRADLIALYETIRANKCKVVWEFGCGYSTHVIAQALYENLQEYNGNQRPYKGTNWLWTLWIIESSHDARWIIGTLKMMRYKFDGIRVIPVTSPVMITSHEGQICHRYDRLPYIMPEFIYLDGPDPKDVRKDTLDITGYFDTSEAMPMSCDMLLVEPFLYPGAIIMVDGRTANARFLQRNFRRLWSMNWQKEEDRTIFTLAEHPFSLSSSIRPAKDASSAQ